MTDAPAEAPEPLLEAFVHGWLRREDGVQPEHYEAYFSADES